MTVGSHPIGRMEGFAFEVDPAARHSDRKMLLAAAERRLGGEYERRGAALAADSDDHFTLRTEPGQPVAMLWRGHEVARLGPGKNLLSPRVMLDRKLERLSIAAARHGDREAGALASRRNRKSARWRSARPDRPRATPRRRPICARSWRCWWTKAGSSPAIRSPGRSQPRPRATTADHQAWDQDRRARSVHARNIEARGAPLANRAARRRGGRGRCPRFRPRRASFFPPPASDGARLLLSRLGFRALGPQMLRVDLVERLATHAHEARAGKQEGPVDEALTTSLGLRPEAVARLMRDLGFRPTADASEAGSGGAAARKPRDQGRPDSAAFAALAELRRG